jgi:hypothetical protein
MQAVTSLQQQESILVLPLHHQQAADELGGDLLRGAAEEGLGGAKRAWWLWEWICEVLLMAVKGTGAIGHNE